MAFSLLASSVSNDSQQASFCNGDLMYVFRLDYGVLADVDTQMVVTVAFILCLSLLFG